MKRFDLQSVVVMAMATASSLSVAFWLTHGEGGASVAHAEAVIVERSGSVRSGAQGRDAQILRAADGHYWAEAEVDGRAVRVLVDTGASVVALTREDARRLGLQLTPASFDRTVQTASGPARAAAITLGAVAVAGAEVREVEALVVEEGLSQSLLGMSYLGRLSAFEATPASLTLRP